VLYISVPSYTIQDEPVILNHEATAAEGYRVAAHLREAYTRILVFPELPDYARRVKEIVIKFELRAGPLDSSHFVEIGDNTLIVRLERDCRAQSIRFYLNADQAPAALLAEVAPRTTCPPGEAPRSTVPALVGGGAPTDCVPVSCKSARACALDEGCRAVTKAAARHNGGIGFVCGCGPGDELNGHTGRCVAVRCDSPTACSPLARCVPKNETELDECNPTPTQGAQWRRGSAPCPRFDCLPDCPE